MTVTCPDCDRPMAGTSCTDTSALPFGDELAGADVPPRCYDCGTPVGGRHHVGCAVARCATCGEQRLFCGCCPDCGGTDDGSGHWCVAPTLGADVDARIYRRIVKQARRIEVVDRSDVAVLEAGRMPIEFVDDDELAAITADGPTVNVEVGQPVVLPDEGSSPVDRAWIVCRRPLDGSVFLIVESRTVGIWLDGGVMTYDPCPDLDSDIWPEPIILPNRDG